MGVFSRRRAPAFTTTEAYGTPNIGSSSGSFDGTNRVNPFEDVTMSARPSLHTKPGFDIGRKLSQAFIPTLAKAPRPSVAETFNNEKADNYPGRNFDAVFRLELEADVLASDEEIEPEEQNIETVHEDHRGWSSALEEEAEAQERRHGRRQASRRKKSSRHTKHQSSRSRSRSNGESHADHDHTLDVNRTITLAGVPSSSPFGRLSTKYQDELSDDDDKSAIRVSDRPLSGTQTTQSIAVPVGDGYDALDVMADYLFRFGCEKKKWFERPPITAMEKRRYNSSKHVTTGVCIRAKTGVQRAYPSNTPGLAAFETAVTALNPEVAFKVKSPIVKTVMSTCITPDMAEFTIDADTRIQILDELSHLARARKHQYAAFIRDEGVLCVWADTVDNIIAATESLEQSLIDFIWHQEHATQKQGFAAHLDAHAQQEKEALERSFQQGNKEMDTSEKTSEKTEVDTAVDAEDLARLQAKQRWKERPVMLYDAVSAGLTVIMIFALLSLGWRTLIKEYVLDGKATRFVLMAVTPLLACVAAFAVQCLVGGFWQIFGPIRQVTQNSAYYSAVAPKRGMGELPHVTVWLPVYKESLEEVIMPTIESLKIAQSVYERQGGSVSILVCDDGLQLISPEDVESRRNFYYDNNMAFVARPGHGVDGFERRGRFKKASNMNFAIQLSLRVEEIMDDSRPDAHEGKGGDAYFWHEQDELDLYDTALERAQEELEGRAWASGNIRIGSYILIIDSDTRVPEDCFADAVSEFALSPEVAVIQHSSGVMQVANHFFENGIAHFTRSIQLAISFCCSNGSTAPFVGHNAFLRWSALQEIIFIEDGVQKIWSESHVSEDFALSLALQLKGYVLRWATYSEDKFEEGVSLTCDDEVNRWQKYAWGCSELIFHPLRYWLFRGPLTPLFRQYLGSNIPIHCKISVLAYIFSYYAIACSWPLTVLNYVLVGFDLPIDNFYLNGWKIAFVCILLFSGLSNVAAIVLRYRLKIKNTGDFAAKQIMFIPFFSIFFTGLSMQIGSALICHMVGYQMTWAATLKTVEVSNFFKEVPAILRKFRFSLPANLILVAGMIVTTSSVVPDGWRVVDLEAVIPLALVSASHILYPIALNPWFMHFSF